MTRTVRAAGVAIILLIQVMTAGCNLSSDPEKLIAKAQEYRGKADYKAAIIELKNVLQKNPDHAEARYLLGVTYNELGDFRSAEDELRRALDRGYDPVKVVPILGEALLKTGQFKKVLEDVKLEGQISDRAQAEILTTRALASIALGRISEAQLMLNEALTKQPGYANALLGQARIAAREKRFEDAMRMVEQAIATEPRSADAWLMKGDLFRLKGDPAAALIAYQKILEFSAENVPARLNIASLDIADGRMADARKQIAEVRKLAPGNPMGMYTLAFIELRERNYAAARNTILQVLKIAPDHLPSLLVAGSAELGLGSHQQAQSYLRRVLERAPNSTYVRKLLASSLGKSGQISRAIEVLQPALRQSSGDLSVMLLAGELYMQSGDFERAEEYFERAAKYAPKNAAIRTRLGASRLAAGDTESALTELESAIQLDSEKYQADVLLITSHLRQKKYDDALKAVQRLEEKQPKNPLTYNLKAAAYTGKRDYASARKYLEHALQLNSAYVPAAVNLARLDLRDKQPQAARRRLESILDKDKDNVAVLLALARFGPHIGATPKEQIGWLERARTASPRSVEPYLMLAMEYARQGDPKKALEVAQEAHSVNPDDARVLQLFGSALLNAGEKERALQTFRKLTVVTPNSPAAWHQLARAEVLNGNKSAAYAPLQKALSIKPDFIEAQVALFGLQLDAKRYNEAHKIAKQVQKQDVKSPHGFTLEGNAFMAERKFLQAAGAYEKAYGIRKDGGLVVKIHQAYVGAGKRAEADERLSRWLDESPSDVAARVYAADLSIKQQDYKAAITHYEALPEKQRETMAVLNNLAWCYHRVGDPRARETAERAFKLRPDNAVVSDTLGMILVSQGDTKRGIDLLQKAATAAPKVPQIRYHLAQGFAKAGDKLKARDELERLLAADVKFPERDEAEKLLKELRN